MKTQNKQILFFFSFYFFFFFQSCVKRVAHDYALEDAAIVIDINLVKIEPLTIKHIQYIPLETSQGCLIGYVDKVLFRDQRIYVADFHQTMALFVFDMNGKFLFKIAMRGNGPEEYISFKDFDIQSNGEIYIFDQFGRKFLIYNNEGKFMSDVKINYYIANFCLIDDKMFWSMIWEKGEMFASLAEFDIEKKSVEFLFTEDKYLHSLSLYRFSPYAFYYSPNNIYYSPKFSEIIYSINNDSVSPVIGIKNLIPPPDNVIEKWIENPNEQGRLIREDTYFIENVYIYETEDYIFIRCMKGAGNILLYNKHLQSVCTVMDLYSTIGSEKIMGSTGKEFFSVIYFRPDINKSHKQILQSHQELESWKEDDNPVIAIFDLDM